MQSSVIKTRIYTWGTNSNMCCGSQRVIVDIPACARNHSKNNDEWRYGCWTMGANRSELSLGIPMSFIVSLASNMRTTMETFPTRLSTPHQTSMPATRSSLRAGLPMRLLRSAEIAKMYHSFSAPNLRTCIGKKASHNHYSSSVSQMKIIDL